MRDVSKDVKVPRELYDEILASEHSLSPGIPVGACWYSKEHGPVGHEDPDGTCWIADSYARLIKLEV